MQLPGRAARAVPPLINKVLSLLRMNQEPVPVREAGSDLGAPLVQVDGLDVTFSARTGLLRFEQARALRGVSLEVFRGETVAVVGESGSGKTTLGRASIGQLKPSRGRVLFDGTDLAALGGRRRKAFRRRAQAIYQDPFASIDPYMTLAETLAEPLEIHGIGDRTERRERIEQALAEVRLTPVQEMANAWPHMISGGQRQRLGIARALMLQPEYLFADEPVSMVDASSRAEILHLLGELQDRHGISMLYVTHDIATARHSARRIVVMYLGEIVEEGPAADVVAAPQHPYTRALIASVPEPDPANRHAHRPVLPGEPPSPMHVPAGCAFHPRCPEAIPGVCDRQPVALEPIGAQHRVACHLYGADGSVESPSDGASIPDVQA